MAFCRVTQAGFLRLLNNARVMGPNVLNARAAWGIYDALRSDGRVRFAAEPTGLEEHWRRATRHTHSGPNFWTEAYLKAFAAEAELTLVTFDQALTRHTTGVRLLGS